MVNFGNEDVGAYSIDNDANNLYLYDLGTMPENGTLDSVTFYDKDSSSNADTYVGIYKDDGDGSYTKIWGSDGTIPYSGTWLTVTADDSVLNSGDKLCFAILPSASSDVEVALDITAGFYVHYKASAYSSGLPDNPDSFTDAEYREASAYITYTQGGATGTNTQINIGDTWKDIDAVQVNIGDTWKEVAGMQVNIGDTWKEVF